MKSIKTIWKLIKANQSKKLTLKDLKKYVQHKKIKGYSKLKKVDMLNYIKTYKPEKGIIKIPKNITTTKKKQLEKKQFTQINKLVRLKRHKKLTNTQLKIYLKKKRIHGYSKMTRKKLLNTVYYTNLTNKELKKRLRDKKGLSKLPKLDIIEKIYKQREEDRKKINIEIVNESRRIEGPLVVIEDRYMLPADSWGHIKGVLKRRYFYNMNDVNEIPDPINKNMIVGKLTEIFNQQDHAFKVNIGFGVLLQHKEKEHIYMFYDGTTGYNNKLFKRPILIDNTNKLNEIINKIMTTDIECITYDVRPNTKWKYIKVIDFNIDVYETNIIMGAPVEVPKFYKNNRYIVSIDDYNDKLCFYRCLALKDGCNWKRCTAKAKKYYQLKYNNKNYKTFEGEKIDNINENANLFKTNIVVYLSEKPNELELFKRSDTNYNDTLNLLKYKDHFCFLKNVKAYGKAYKCNNCDYVAKLEKHLKEHKKVCKNGKTYIKLVGGYWGIKKSIVETLFNQLPKTSKKIKNRFYDYFINFDLESLLLPVNEKKGPTTKIIRKHVPVSVSICSNIPNYNKPKHILSKSDKDEDIYNFVKEMFQYLLKLSGEAEKLTKEKFKLLYEYFNKKTPIYRVITIKQFTKLYNQINEKSKKYKNLIKDKETIKTLYKELSKKFYISSPKGMMSIKLEEKKFKSLFNKIIKKSEQYKQIFSMLLKKLKDPMITKLNKFCGCCPVIGFNSSFYDINIIKGNIYKVLEELKEDITGVIKDGSRFKMLDTTHLKFLDQQNYVAPNYSLDLYIKAFAKKAVKGYFPYEWLDNYDKLNYDKLPPREAFYSDLKKMNTLNSCDDKRRKNLLKKHTKKEVDEMIINENYNKILKIWETEKMQTMKDYLEYYNNLDVEPFIEAIQIQKEGFQNDNLDMHKDAIAITGLTKKYMYNLLKKKNNGTKFSLIKQCDEDLYHMFKKNVVGGPSIVFHRYHEKDVTKLRGLKLCKKIIGYDANALYLWAISQNMPTGDYKRYRIPDKQIKKFLTKILENKFFGFVVCDIHTPDKKKKYFEDMAPIFKNMVITKEDIGDHMTTHVNNHKIRINKGRKLIDSYYGEKILLFTPLLKWYIQHGLIITKIHECIKYTPNNCFKKFADKISDDRREGDRDPDSTIKAESAKLTGNTGYGYTLTNKEKHNNVKVCDKHKAVEYVRKNTFKDMNVLDNDFYEVIYGKSRITADLPIQIGHAVYQLAKLRMLQFKYDFIDYYIDRSDYQYCEMDTDSAYIAFSDSNIENLIKSDKLDHYKKHKYEWLPREDTEEHKAYDKRKAGLFKEEYRGNGIVCLNSKVYYCKNDETGYNKYSCKGVQKKNNLTFEHYKNVLMTGKTKIVKNSGFRVYDNKIYSYEIEKSGLSYYYDKREVLSDGVSTKPMKI